MRWSPSVSTCRPGGRSGGSSCTGPRSVPSSSSNERPARCGGSAVVAHRQEQRPVALRRAVAPLAAVQRGEHVVDRCVRCLPSMPQGVVVGRLYTPAGSPLVIDHGPLLPAPARNGRDGAAPPGGVRSVTGSRQFRLWCSFGAAVRPMIAAMTTVEGMRALRSFTVRPSLPGELAALEHLAMNLRWSWDEQTRDLFRWVDPDGWDATAPRPGAPARDREPRAARRPDRRRRLRPLPRRGARRADAATSTDPAGSRPATAPRRRCARSPTSPPSSGSPRRSRSTPAASGCWPATT